MPSIAIIIIHWKDEIQTLECLHALVNWDFNNNGIFLVQNEYSGKSLFDKIANEDSRIETIVSKKNLGFGGANNLALKEAISQGYDYSLLLNGDAKISEEATLKLAKVLNENENVFCVGPKIKEFQDADEKLYLGGQKISEALNTRILYIESMGSEQLKEVDYCIGAAVLVNNKEIESVGYFDEDYFFSGEMADLCYRAWQNNKKVIVDTQLEAVHK